MAALVTFVSSDGQLFEIPLEDAVQCATVKNMFGDVNVNVDEHIPLPEVGTAVMMSVIEFLAHLTKRGDAEDFASQDAVFAASYVEVSVEYLLEVLLAANHLDCKPLLDACSIACANLIKNKTTEEIRETFKIENDFTPDEEEALRKKNEWCI